MCVRVLCVRTITFERNGTYTPEATKIKIIIANKGKGIPIQSRSFFLIHAALTSVALCHITYISYS